VRTTRRGDGGPTPAGAYHAGDLPRKELHVRTRILASLAALALLAGACGSDSDDASPEGTTTTTVGATTSVTPDGDGTTFGDVVRAVEDETARFEGVLRLVGSAGSQLTEPVEVLVAGSLDPQRDASQISMDLSTVAQAAVGGAGGAEVPDALAAMFDEPFEIITIGETSWMRFPLLAMMTGVTTEWLEVPPDEAGDLTSGLGLGSSVTSPLDLLEHLRTTDAEVEEVGTETVRGQQTTRYRMLVDVGDLGQDLSADDRDQLADELGGLDEPLPVEVWVGDDGRLHRYTVELVGAAGADPELESTTIEFEFFDHGTDVSIDAPPADQVTPMDALGGLMGGAGGARD
jgi:hypothetical protein